MDTPHLISITRGETQTADSGAANWDQTGRSQVSSDQLDGCFPVYVNLLSNLMNHANELGRGSIYGPWEGSVGNTRPIRSQGCPGDRPLSACWEAKFLPRHIVSSGDMPRTEQALPNDLVAALGHLDTPTGYLLGVGGCISNECAPLRRCHETPFPPPDN